MANRKTKKRKANRSIKRKRRSLKAHKKAASKFSRRKRVSRKRHKLSKIRTKPVHKVRRLKSTSIKKPMPRHSIYTLNPNFGSFYELRDLVLKSLPAEKDRMTERINKLGHIKLAVISGIFINKDNSDPSLVDLLMVGDDIDSRRLHSFLKSLEAEVGKEIKFAVMDKEEFQYRLAMFDRFVRALMEGPHEKLINKLGL